VNGSSSGRSNILENAYSTKEVSYYEGAREDYISSLPANSSANILEIGCGQGATGALALSTGKCDTYCGIEQYEKAAFIAKGRISQVLVGNIETLELPWPPGYFDVLILSEVIEHLVDPWSTLRKLRPFIKSSGLVFASSPNVSHYSVISMLLRGHWDLTDIGILDRTHLRWFTPKTYRYLFESCGYVVDSVGSVGSINRTGKILSGISFGRIRHLFITQIDLRAHCV
jgi:2-polyprenyl-3-methyl-5-hydroxy-6-metoxy-1,4-benzoquinol methylase